MADNKVGRKVIIGAVAKKSEITTTLCDKVIENFIADIKGRLLNGDRIIFQKLFSLWLTNRSSRVSRNPKDGSRLVVPATKVVSLRISKEIKAELVDKN